MEENSENSAGILLVLPPLISRSSGNYYIDSQAMNGIRLWAANFGRVMLCAPVIERDRPQQDNVLLDYSCGVEFIPLPYAIRPLTFLRALPRGMRTLVKAINSAGYLQFAIGGIWGDWGAMAAVLAWVKRRPAAIWTDRVESQVMRFQASGKKGLKRLNSFANAFLAARLERFVISHSALGLFHGSDTYEAYSPYSPNPQMVHNIHLGADARISVAEITEKQKRTGPWNIVYAGRVHPDKGFADWIQCLLQLEAQGIDFKATWFGSGADIEVARAQASQLKDKIEFPGPEFDRDRLLAHIRTADIFMFCHKTMESPRCLIEALICGTPIIGYWSHYAADLIKANGGGMLTRPRPEALAEAIGSLSRARLSTLTEAAFRDAEGFTDVETFRHRSDLIKQYAGMSVGKRW